MSDVLNIDAILSAGLVDRVIYRQCVSSTNDLARELAATACRQECWLLVAEQQTAGRGRGDNRWWTGEGSLAFSLLVDPEHLGIHGPRLPMVSLAAAVAVVEASQPLVSGWKVGLHWPNDVYACGRKLAGILTDGDVRRLVLQGANLACTVREVMKRNPITIDADATASWSLTRAFTRSRCRRVVEYRQ